jgi:hypothetical protein
VSTECLSCSSLADTEAADQPAHTAMLLKHSQLEDGSYRRFVPPCLASEGRSKVAIHVARDSANIVGNSCGKGAE